ncbi:hypothetical protein ACFQ7Z_36690 [Streptomyces virginiae]|uniref:hypothetical protein n=1 Tax=Streptomyces virginiae TaxID=1961 RepID=UPI0036A221F9
MDSGAAMLELDVRTDFPSATTPNRENATTPGQLRTRARNQPLAGCLADTHSRHDAHPGHRPVVLKPQLKDGFAANLGRGPAELDALLTGALGDAVHRPGQLAARHPDLDATPTTSPPPSTPPAPPKPGPATASHSSPAATPPAPPPTGARCPRSWPRSSRAAGDRTRPESGCGKRLRLKG